MGDHAPVLYIWGEGQWPPWPNPPPPGSYIPLYYYTDITEELNVPLDGFCLDIQSSAIPNVVFPRRNSSEGRDCICSIIINLPCYDFSSCSCINETIFLSSVYTCKLQHQSPPVYHMCFINLDTEMNNTVIHIFESYRYCISDEYNFNNYKIKFYRDYRKSFRIITGMIIIIIVINKIFGRNKIVYMYVIGMIMPIIYMPYSSTE